MRVRRSGENAELREHLGGDAILREHALDRVGNNKFRILRAHLSNILVALATDVARKEHILVLRFLFTRESNLFCIDHDNEVTGIDGWRIRRLVPAANHVGGFDSETAKWNAFGIDQIPFGLHCLLFGEEGFHEKRGQELGFRGSVSTPVFRGNENLDRGAASNARSTMRGLVSWLGCASLLE